MKEKKNKPVESTEEVKDNAIEVTRFEVEQLLNTFVGNIKINGLSAEDKIAIIKFKLELSKVIKEIEEFRKTTIESLEKPEKYDELKESAEKEGADEETKKLFREVETEYNKKFSEVAIPYYNASVSIPFEGITEDAFFNILTNNNTELLVFGYEHLYDKMVKK
jgi:hypothetical protein